jgi:hypothetical protein
MCGIYYLHSLVCISLKGSRDGKDCADFYGAGTYTKLHNPAPSFAGGGFEGCCTVRAQLRGVKKRRLSGLGSPFRQQQLY